MLKNPPRIFFVLSKNIIPIVSSSPGHFLLLPIVKSVDGMTRVWWSSLALSRNAELFAVGWAFKRNSGGKKKKLSLCLRVHADGPVEDRSYFIALEKGFALKC